MKTLLTPAAYFKNLLTASFLMLSLAGLSQEKPNTTTLQVVVDGIKQKNAAIKNADSINVMVDDLLIKDLKAFTLDPKHIGMVEVLVLDSKPGQERVNPAIIINTK